MTQGKRLSPERSRAVLRAYALGAANRAGWYRRLATVLHKRGIDPATLPPDLAGIARMVGVPAERLDAMAYPDLERETTAWVARQRVKSQLRASGPATHPDPAETWNRILWALVGSLAYPTGLVRKLAGELQRLKPARGEAPSPACLVALARLEENLPDPATLAGWPERTGQPPPGTLAELQRQAALAGIAPERLLEGDWTPGGILDVILGALERRHANGKADGPGESTGGRKKRRRYKTDNDPAADARLVKDWEAAKRLRNPTIAEHCRELGIDEADFRAAQDRHRKR